jgi:hypothetical protein
MKASSVNLMWSVVLAGCATAAPAPPAAPPSQPALLVANDAACLSAIAGAATRLTGRSVTLAANAFVLNDSVVLTSAGQMADGRMTRPMDVLQLRLAPDGCELRMEGQEKAIALKACRCRPLTAR